MKINDVCDTMNSMKRAFFTILCVLGCNALFAQGASLDQAVQSMTFSGEIWALQPDGRRVSPTIFHNQTTTTRVNFTTSVANATMTVNLWVSSEQGFDWAFVGNLNSPASRTNNHTRISGEDSRTVVIIVPTPGNHFIEIGYSKDASVNHGSDRAWFSIAQTGGTQALTGQTGTIGNMTFSGETWALQPDGRRVSPAISHNQTTTTRVNFTTSGANTTVTIHLWVSSEQGFDWAFVGNLNSPASRTNNHTRISGEDSRTVVITVPTPGNHFIEIGYSKDASINRGSDRAWFRVEQTGGTQALAGQTGALTGQTGALTGQTGALTGQTGALTGQTGALTGQTGGRISNITFSGATWALQPDGRRMSPAISHNRTTTTRVNFTTSVANATVTIHLWVSSERNFDLAFVGNLNSPASRTNNHTIISGEDSRTVVIIVPTPGNHFIEIGYSKDGSLSHGSDRAWFRVE